ncbi:hypothetical protein NLI96_g3915 [Meripilus lineatus]|uniref:Uncharacterized protein n=1 Tax=Meripilus lineatus TaxID=2056292 RepID=A0AAD5YG63_9APHY|nr:hypothetical protein NLI96_g3915 [Physisporinus lineatus]
MGAILSSLGVAVDAIIKAAWTIFTTLVSLVATLVVTFFDIIYDIVCCKCFGDRAQGKRTGTHIYKFGKKKVDPEDNAEPTAPAPAN